jgi:hypothetical protein
MNPMKTPNHRWSRWQWFLVAFFAIGLGTPIASWIKSEWERNRKFNVAKARVPSEHLAALQAYAERTSLLLPSGGLNWRGVHADTPPPEVTIFNPFHGSFEHGHLSLALRGMSIRVDRDVTTEQWHTTIKPR